MDWQCEVKSCAVSEFRLHPDSATVPFNDAFADRQPDTRTWILGMAVQALEDYEYFFRVLGL